MKRRSKSKISSTDIQMDSTETRDVLASNVLVENIRAYGLSVMEDRMISSILDGLKPSQRRLLKSMYDLKAWSNGPCLKSARVTGDCMGKYHPHSEAYGALANLVNQRYSLIEGQGNWGNLDDEPAAPRYTECRFSPLGQLAFSNYEVADEIPNFSGEYQEPIDIPSIFPGFFVNETEGIGVGLRVEIPPHNLAEIVEALKIVIQKGNSAETKDIFEIFHGPDYLLGGKILTPQSELIKVYETGSGRIEYECEYEVENSSDKEFLLRVVGYCLGFKPSKFISKMEKLLKEGIISNVNESSDREHPCNLEVTFENRESLEKILPHLRTSSHVQYWGLYRTKSSNLKERDVDVEAISGGILEYMRIWIKWMMKKIEELLNRDIEKLQQKIIQEKCKIFLCENPDALAEIVKSKNPSSLIQKKLSENDIEVDLESLKWISDLRISSLYRVEISNSRKKLKAYNANLEDDVHKLKDLKSELISRLDALKPFYQERKTKYI